MATFEITSLTYYKLYFPVQFYATLYSNFTTFQEEMHACIIWQL